MCVCRQEMRRNRVNSNTGNIRPQVPQEPTIKTAVAPVKINVRDYGYLRVGNCAELIKLNWRKGKKLRKAEGIKLFTVAVVEKLIQVSK